jgi:hypothetical protein
MSSTAHELELRLEKLRSGAAYQNYSHVREQVLAMKSAVRKDSAEPSQYWSVELENIEYAIDASPLVVERLRHHAYHITGVWPYHYRPHQDERRARHETKLNALHKLGHTELFVPEAPALGGFGFELSDGLTNIDTLKFYEVMIALDRAEVLQELRGAATPTIWEIGAGWGGFAYQIKTLLPGARYIISDFPELFLFSATYLMTTFPDATFSFYTGGTPDWSADFLFMPHWATQAVCPPALDLVVNMVSFQEMTTEQVRSYVNQAANAGARFLYSLNRDRSSYNPELTSVREVIAERYWLRPISVLSVGYPELPKEIPPSGVAAAKKALRKNMRKPKDGLGDRDYRHVVGWPRIDA